MFQTSNGLNRTDGLPQAHLDGVHEIRGPDLLEGDFARHGIDAAMSLLAAVVLRLWLKKAVEEGKKQGG